jgi:hypothetical protein
MGLGSVEYSDGRFIWPEGLAHYVEEHQARLPDEFVDSVLQGQGHVPSSS